VIIPVTKPVTESVAITLNTYLPDNNHSLSHHAYVKPKPYHHFTL